MYIRNEYEAGDVIDVEKHYPGRYGNPDMPRAKKRKRTPEDIKKQNQTNKANRIRRLILANFKVGDWHLVLDYEKDKRPDYKTSKKHIKKFLSEMRKAYQKAGYQFKYIVCTERGKKGNAMHHHLVIQDIAEAGLITTKLVKELWTYGQKMKFIPLYEKEEFKQLASYIVKLETKQDTEWSTYSRSRNLVVPQKKTKEIHRNKWRIDPKPAKGYYIIKDSVVNGINPVTGYPYQHYSMKKLGSNKPRDRGD